MSDEANKALARRIIEEAFDRGDLTVIDELFHPDVYDYGEPYHAAGVRRYVERYRAAFPDLRAAVEDLVAEGDKVVVRWVMRGAHRGEFRGTAPTGAAIELTLLTVLQVADGRVVHFWQESDAAGLMRQLGFTLPW
jgi:steroid delta-isomerase-like uncharacterized protein